MVVYLFNPAVVFVIHLQLLIEHLWRVHLVKKGLVDVVPRLVRMLIHLHDHWPSQDLKFFVDARYDVVHKKE